MEVRITRMLALTPMRICWQEKVGDQIESFDYLFLVDLVNEEAVYLDNGRPFTSKPTAEFTKALKEVLQSKRQQMQLPEKLINEAMSKKDKVLEKTNEERT